MEQRKHKMLHLMDIDQWNNAWILTVNQFVVVLCMALRRLFFAEPFGIKANIVLETLTYY